MRTEKDAAVKSANELRELLKQLQHKNGSKRDAKMDRKVVSNLLREVKSARAQCDEILTLDARSK